ncbi:MAG: hypothetical protein KAR43_03995, partial [Deltaproteobacteria bacterium]|nr:hypothetical protein [Deltaproteobacteria bacterium]
MIDEGLFKLFPEDEDTKASPWQSVSGELMSAVQESFKPFEAVVMDEYEGIDLTSVRNFENSLEKGFVDPHAKKSYGASPSLDKKEAESIS